MHTPRLLRSCALAALVAAVVASGSVARPAAADAPLTIRVGAGANDTVSNLFDAIQLGYFKARGLDVQIQIMNSGAAEAAALAGGALDIAESNVVSTSAAHLRGIPFTYIAPGAEYNTNAPTTLMICPKNSPVKTGKDLNGKNFGVVALADLSQLGPITWIDSTGGDGSTIHYVEMPAAGMGAAIERGTVDAAMVPEPALQIALASGASKVCAKAFDAVAPAFMLNGWITTTDYVKKNPAAVRKFRDAMLDAAKWANKNHKASAEIFKQYSKAPPDVIDAMTRATFAEKFDPDLFQPVINAAAKYKFIDRPFPAADILTL
jgi:NitT/TauT family transport system substrate-binding protein